MQTRWKPGAGGRSRTADTGIFSPLLYHLSYPGARARHAHSIVEHGGSEQVSLYSRSRRQPHAGRITG
jgi:hypothetical protein